MLSLTTKFGTPKFGVFIATAALAIGLAGAAPAATLSWSALPAISTGNPLATIKSGTVIENDATDTLDRKGPWSGTPTPVVGVSQSYTSLGRNSSADYVFDGLFRQLSFVWGTPDKFNKVEFFRDGILIDTILGFGNGRNIALPTLLATTASSFDTVRFFSRAPTFEYANISVSGIPVPATGLLLLTAVGGIAALRRRMAA